MNKTLRVVPSSAHPDNLAIGVTNGGVQLTHKQLAECCATLSEQVFFTFSSSFMWFRYNF